MANLFEVNKVLVNGAEITSSDVNRLLTARTDSSFQKFIGDYSLHECSLFGLSEDGMSLDYKTTINDCKTLQALINAGMRLYGFMKDPMLAYEDANLYDMSRLAIGAGPTKGEKGGLSLSISLSGGKGAGAFLQAGLVKAPLNTPLLDVNKSDKEPESLFLCGYTFNENLENIFISLFDGLSNIMLHDLLTTVRVNKIVVTSPSMASTLWLAFLEMFRTGEIINCIECGAPTFALPKRRNKRRFCSDRCRQAHFRNANKQ